MSVRLSSSRVESSSRSAPPTACLSLLLVQPHRHDIRPSCGCPLPAARADEKWVMIGTSQPGSVAGQARHHTLVDVFEGQSVLARDHLSLALEEMERSHLGLWRALLPHPTEAAVDTLATNHGIATSPMHLGEGRWLANFTGAACCPATMEGCCAD